MYSNREGKVKVEKADCSISRHNGTHLRGKDRRGHFNEEVSVERASNIEGRMEELEGEMISKTVVIFLLMRMMLNFSRSEGVQP